MPDQDGQQPPQPHSELASFGEELRREREIRGISLKEIADATKISKRFLDAIERNDHKTLPAPVFTRGFVREYAKYLGLNADEMVSRYNYAAAGDDRIEKSAHLDRLVTPPTPAPAVREKPKPKGIPPAYARVDRNIIITVIIVAALAGLSYWALKHKREVASAMHEEPAATATHAPKPAPAATTSSAAAAPAPAAPVNDDTLRLVVEATANSWVVLDADGKTVYSDEMHKGDRSTYEAKERFRFRTIGNAAGLHLTLNELVVPPLGAEGEVVHDRVFDRDFLTRERAAAKPQNPSSTQ